MVGICLFLTCKIPVSNFLTGFEKKQAQDLEYDQQSSPYSWVSYPRIQPTVDQVFICDCLNPQIRYWFDQWVQRIILYKELEH